MPFFNSQPAPPKLLPAEAQPSTDLATELVSALEKADAVLAERSALWNARVKEQQDESLMIAAKFKNEPDRQIHANRVLNYRFEKGPRVPNISTLCDRVARVKQLSHQLTVLAAELRGDFARWETEKGRYQAELQVYEAGLAKQREEERQVEIKLALAELERKAMIESLYRERQAVKS